MDFYTLVAWDLGAWVLGTVVTVFWGNPFMISYSEVTCLEGTNFQHQENMIMKRPFHTWACCHGIPLTNVRAFIQARWGNAGKRMLAFSNSRWNLPAMALVLKGLKGIAAHNRVWFGLSQQRNISYDSGHSARTTQKCFAKSSMFQCCRHFRYLSFFWCRGRRLLLWSKMKSFLSRRLLTISANANRWGHQAHFLGVIEMPVCLWWNGFLFVVTNSPDQSPADLMWTLNSALSGVGTWRI